MNRKYLTIALLTCVCLLAVGIAHASGIAPAQVGAIDTFDLLPLAPMLIGSINDTVAQNRDSNFVSDTVRAQLNAIIRDAMYAVFHRPAWQVAANAVAPPVLAIATETKTVKSTATTELVVNGVLKSLSATDPLMVLANVATDDPNTLAAGYVRRWQICWDGTNATTVISIRPSNDKAIADYASAAEALDACRWSSLPATGTVIVGLVDITNVTNPFIPGTTALSAAGVTDAYHDGPDANCFIATPVTP